MDGVTLKNQRVLVTGGAGMIGSNLVRRLAQMQCQVLVIDNLWRGKLSYLLDDQGRAPIDLDTSFHQLDLSQAGTFEHVFDGVDLVVHLADVVAGINYVFGNQGALLRQNLLINTNVAHAVRSCAPRGYLYVGTACSYPAALQSSTSDRLLVEADAYPAWPESAYGWSKLIGEYEAELLEKETGTPVAILRLHNVYGAPCDYSAERAQVIPALIRKAVRHPDEPFVVWGSGAQGRAFVHVDDVVTAILATLERGFGEGVIQVGPDVCVSIREIAETVVAVSGKSIPVVYDTSRPEGDHWRAADYGKARQKIGWAPTVDLPDGIARTYRWVADAIAGEGRTRQG